MYERIKHLPNVNGNLYIYSSQSGILAITSDLDECYYSVYLDGIEPQSTGLFITSYPNDFEMFKKRFMAGIYGAPADTSILKIFKSFEITTEQEITHGFDMKYPLYQGMINKLLKFAVETGTHTQPYNRYIGINVDNNIATLAGTDNKSMCVFDNIPVESVDRHKVQYIISDVLASAALNLPVSEDITISKIINKERPTSEYKIQIMCGDYMFAIKQWIQTYPRFMEVANYYKPEMATPLKLTMQNITNLKLIKSVDGDEEQRAITLKDINIALNLQPGNINTCFNGHFTDKIFMNLANMDCTLRTGGVREQMQLRCKWGKAQEYTQILCLMPIETFSLCNLRDIKNLI